MRYQLLISDNFGNLLNRAVRSTVALAVQLTRTYSRFSGVADDVVEARIYLGIHFRFADTVARRHGKQSADQAFSHFLRPLD